MAQIMEVKTLKFVNHFKTISNVKEHITYIKLTFYLKMLEAYKPGLMIIHNNIYINNHNKAK
jgi:hypothetical protein